MNGGWVEDWGASVRVRLAPLDTPALPKAAGAVPGLGHGMPAGAQLPTTSCEVESGTERMHPAPPRVKGEALLGHCGAVCARHQGALSSSKSSAC